MSALFTLVHRAPREETPPTSFPDRRLSTRRRARVRIRRFYRHFHGSLSEATFRLRFRILDCRKVDIETAKMQQRRQRRAGGGGVEGGEGGLIDIDFRV